MRPHHSLNSDAWRKYDFPTQILMIANELNRAANALRRDDPDAATLALARALELADLTAEVNRRRNLLRELRRWRGLVAAEYLNPRQSTVSIQALLKTLLLFSGVSARQIPYLNVHTCSHPDVGGPPGAFPGRRLQGGATISF